MDVKSLVCVAEVFAVYTVADAMNVRDHVRFVQSENMSPNVLVMEPRAVKESEDTAGAFQKLALFSKYKLTFPSDNELDESEIDYDTLKDLRKAGYELMYSNKSASVIKFEQAFFGNERVEKLYREFCETIKADPKCASLYIGANYESFISLAVGYRDLGATIAGLYKSCGGGIYCFWLIVAEKTSRR